MSPKDCCYKNSANCESNGACNCRTDNSKTGAENGKFNSENVEHAGFVNEHKVEHNVCKVHNNAYLHRCFCIAGSAKNRSENNACGSRKHWNIDDEEILSSGFADVFIDLHPYRHCFA